VKLKIFFLVKESVGQSFLRSLLEETHLQFERGPMSDEGTSFKLSAVTAAVSTYNHPEAYRGVPKPAYAFWQMYERVPGHWCKITSPEDQAMDSVAGFEAIIPWAMLGAPGIETLQDLAQLTRLGITLPIAAFELGVEEFELQFLGDTFWFRISLAEDGILAPLHEMCLMQHTASDETEKHMPMGTGFSGVQILDRFLREFLQQRSILPRPERNHFAGGFSGPGGEEIHFYPDIPKEFSQSSEMDKYSFKVTTRERDFAPYIEAAEKAANENARDPKNYLDLARLYWAQGRLSQAIKTLKAAVSKASPHWEIHQLMGALLSKVGRSAEALEHFRCATLLNEDSVATQTGLAIALSESGNHAEAIQHFQKAVDIQPGDATLQHNLGFAFAKDGQNERAIPHLQRAADSGHVESIKLVAAFISEFQGKKEARPYLERAVELSPQDADAWEQLGSNHAICKEPEKAIEYYRKALAANDRKARTHELLAATLAGMGQWEEAEVSMRRAVELAPDNAQINRNLAAILANLGRFDEAAKFLVRLMELDPTLLQEEEEEDGSVDSSPAPGTAS